jgi:methylated-DNA-[protein]-cysteine S-methyltransferase
LLTIPFGTTISYAELAGRIGRPGASRAVGAANGKNPIGIIVPCHRVIGADGTLTGYGGGLDRKEWLITHEASLLARHDRSSPPPGKLNPRKGARKLNVFA